MSAHEPVGGRLLTKPFMVFAVLAMIGFAILAARFIFGLGAVTNLNDGYTWGIWIVVDIMIGTALGCAGYSVALLVYLLNRGEYHPLVRPALLAGLFGYTLGGMAAVIDLGRYWQMYTLFLPWYAQFNSIMLEVAWCVTAYTVVLWIEFTPTFLERLGLKNLKQKLSKVLFIFIAVGILLPTMHQSSLGTMLVALGYQVSPLWQTQWIGLLFLVSAILMGYAVVPFEGILASMGLHRPVEGDLIARLSRVMFVVLAGYLIIRFADLIARGALGLAFAGDLDAVMFWVENFLFVVPLLLLVQPGNRSSPRMIFIAAISLLLAGSIYRINAYLVGYHPAGGGWHYFPSVAEMLVTVGIFSLEVVAYLVFVKKLPVLHRA